MTSARVANHMTNFYFRTIGCLARNPELVTCTKPSPFIQPDWTLIST